jgi:hypothetical protein
MGKMIPSGILYGQYGSFIVTSIILQQANVCFKNTWNPATLQRFIGAMVDKTDDDENTKNIIRSFENTITTGVVGVLM